MAFRRGTRTNAGDEAALLPDLVALLVRVEADRGVEVGEEHDQDTEHAAHRQVVGANQVVVRRTAAPTSGRRFAKEPGSTAPSWRR